MRKYLRYWLVILLLACSSRPELIGSYIGKVVGVKDGDTVVVLFNGIAQTIRLQGIDCPEKRQAFGKQAKQFTALFCYGKEATIQSDGEKDRYKRIIAEVIVDGKSLNEELLKAGLAWHYTKYSSDSHLAELESNAKRQGIGLWADSNPIAPWEFRGNKFRK